MQTSGTLVLVGSFLDNEILGRESLHGASPPQVEAVPRGPGNHRLQLPWLCFFSFHKDDSSYTTVPAMARGHQGRSLGGGSRWKTLCTQARVLGFQDPVPFVHLVLTCP